MEKKLDFKKVNKLQGSPVLLCDTILLHEYVSRMIRLGKKEKGELYMYRVLRDLCDIQIELSKEVIDLVEILVTVIENVRPYTTLIIVKKGGKKYHIAVGLWEQKSLGLGLDWVVRESVRKNQRMNLKFYDLLLKSIVESFRGEGLAVLKRNLLYEEALKSRVYLKFL